MPLQKYSAALASKKLPSGLVQMTELLLNALYKLILPPLSLTGVCSRGADGHSLPALKEYLQTTLT